MPEPALDHAAEIVTKIQSLAGAFENDPLVDERGEARALVRLRRRFKDGSRLAVTVLVEYASGRTTWLKYAFHFMDATDRMVFRYDNTPHYGDLPGFPHHKHIGENEAVVDTAPPDVDIIVAEIRARLSG